jgi:hypothetical protein
MRRRNAKSSPNPRNSQKEIRKSGQNSRNQAQIHEFHKRNNKIGPKINEIKPTRKTSSQNSRNFSKSQNKSSIFSQIRKEIKPKSTNFTDSQTNHSNSANSKKQKNSTSAQSSLKLHTFTQKYQNVKKNFASVDAAPVRRHLYRLCSDSQASMIFVSIRGDSLAQRLVSQESLVRMNGWMLEWAAGRMDA